jgi:hypothetical protein
VARRTKRALLELDEAIDQLGGGVPPIRPPKPSPRARRPKSTRAKAKTKKR